MGEREDEKGQEETEIEREECGRKGEWGRQR